MRRSVAYSSTGARVLRSGLFVLALAGGGGGLQGSAGPGWGLRGRIWIHGWCRRIVRAMGFRVQCGGERCRWVERWCRIT
jgi:hypothetical protein